MDFPYEHSFIKLKKLIKKLILLPFLYLGIKNQELQQSSLLGSISGKITAVDLFLSGYYPSLITNWKNKKINTQDFINKNKVEFSSEIIKEPHLSIFYDELKIEYPNSKFVMIIRNPFDNIRSILDRLNVEGNQIILNKNDKKNSFIHGIYY